MTRIAFLGLGRMGSGMAARLVAAGHALSVYNRTPGRAEPLRSAGAAVAGSPRDACAGAEVVIAMTADDESSRAVWYGADGALAARLAPAAIVVECSTLSHAWVLELARQAAALDLRYIDCPVTGLPAAAAAGDLTLLVGAEAGDLAAALPVLDALATRLLHFGSVGAGTAYKLAINLIGAVQIASAAEGMAIAERAGLDLRAVADAIATSQASSPQVVRNTRRMAAGDHGHDVAFTPVLRLKDIEYALRLAATLGVAAPFGAAARAAFARLIELGAGADNESRVIDVARGSEPARRRR